MFFIVHLNKCLHPVFNAIRNEFWTYMPLLTYSAEYSGDLQIARFVIVDGDLGTYFRDTDGTTKELIYALVKHLETKISMQSSIHILPKEFDPKYSD